MEDRAVIVMGAGNATGGAIARRFAREGYTACISRRNVEKLQPLVQSIEEAGGRVRAFGADARKEDQLQDMFRTVEEEVGPIEVCVFNVGGNVRFPLEETHLPGVLQSLGNGLFCRVPHRPGGGSLHETQRPRDDPFHRGDLQHAWRFRFCCLQRG